MVLSIKEKFKLKKFIRELEQVRGRHTELVSVYIPVGYDINKIINHLAQEQGTAANIKDKTTRLHVIDSLEKIIRHLRLFKQTPPNGLAVFAGDFSEIEGKPDIRVVSIEPPEPINMRIYRCDQTFKLDILKSMLKQNEIYGLLVIDRREATIGLLNGTEIKVLNQLTSGVPGKTKAGGQCLHPETAILLSDGQYVMLEELKEDDEVKSYDLETKQVVTSKVTKVWKKKVEKVYHITAGETLICSKDHLIFLADGSTKAAEELKVGDLLIDENGKEVAITKIIAKDLVVNLIDIEVEHKNFFAEGILVHNSAHRFERLREGAAKDFYRRISEAMKKEFFDEEHLKGILIGGPGPTKEQYLREGQLVQKLKDKIVTVQDLGYTGDFGLNELVEKSQSVLAKESITEEKDMVNRFLKILATKPPFATYGVAEVKKALELNAVKIMLLSENLDDTVIEELEEAGELQGAEVKIISLDTPEGLQLKNLGGAAAILRFPVEF